MTTNLLKLAWRNLWRSKQRSLIAVSSLVLAIFLAFFLRSMQLGAYQVMIDTSIRYGTGFIQVHEKGYWEDKSINNLLLDKPEFRQQIGATEHITEVIPRLENAGLAIGAKKTEPVFIQGIYPEGEDKISKISEKLIAGAYLTSQDTSVLLGSRLAEKLKLSVNDTLVMIGQGYHGMSAAGKYLVKGIIKHPNHKLDKALVYTTLKTAQSFHSAENLISAYLINIEKPEQLETVQASLQQQFGKDYEIMSWDDMTPQLKQVIKQDARIGYLMLSILYLVVGLGIFGTVLMMTMERKREFGVLVAVGMKKSNINALILFESLMIGITALFLASIIVVPLVYYMTLHPIPLQGDAAKGFEQMGAEPVIKFILSGTAFLFQVLVTMLIMLLSVLIPFVLIRKLKVVEAIK